MKRTICIILGAILGLLVLFGCQSSPLAPQNNYYTNNIYYTNSSLIKTILLVPPYNPIITNFYSTDYWMVTNSEIKVGRGIEHYMVSSNNITQLDTSAIILCNGFVLINISYTNEIFYLSNIILIKIP